MDGNDLILGLRVALSLACVLGLMWYLGKRMSGGKGSPLRRRRAEAISVVGRQSLGGKTALALVEVDGRRLLLGVSERGVNLLTELDAAPVPAEATAANDVVTERVELDAAALERSLNSLSSPSTPAARKPAVTKPRNPLEGSILDATLWRQAVVAVQERTIRH